MKRNEINCIYIPDKDDQILQIEKERDRIINDLDNQYTYYTVRRKKIFFFDYHIICNTCKRNCRSPCYCSYIFGCKIFTFSGYCKECGHHKRSHDIHSTYKYVYETKRDKKDNSEKIQKERDRFWEKYKEIIKENYRKKNLKENKEREKNS